LRKKKHEPEENHERWLVSYADFITLLFAFFTTLYAISTVDSQKMGKMVTSMRESFDSNLFPPGSRELSFNSGSGNNPSARDILQGVDLRGVNSKESASQSLRDMKVPAKRAVLNGEKDMGRLKREVEARLNADVLKGRVRTRIESRGLIITLGEGGVFDSGSDEIKPEGKALLETIAASLASVGNQIRVEGHTDNMPISNSRFPSNWELSTARATQMLRFLIVKSGLQPDLISAAGYAEYRPAASNDTAEGRASNRRVDLVILNPAAAQVEPRIH
jgi:chemotaxis protein MotB